MCSASAPRRHHRYHDAERADIQRAGDEMIFAARHANHRHEREAAAERELGLQRFEAKARVLHVVENEIGAGIDADLRQARHEAFEHKGTGSCLAALQGFLDRIVSHGCGPYSGKKAERSVPVSHSRTVLQRPSTARFGQAGLHRRRTLCGRPYQRRGTYHRRSINARSTLDQRSINARSTLDQRSINARSTLDQRSISARSALDQRSISADVRPYWRRSHAGRSLPTTCWPRRRSRSRNASVTKSIKSRTRGIRRTVLR